MSLAPMNNNSQLSYENPFARQGGNGIVNAGSGRVTDTQVATKELGEIQARVFLAKQFSRNPAEAYDRIMTACQRPGLANVAIYTFARGGTNINGPSIRLAEEIVRDWGNIDCGWVELERRKGESTVRAYAWDLETNAYKQLIFVVPHVRSKKSAGQEIQVPITNERDLYELIANQASRRLRNCILTLIPGDVVEAAVDQCHRTLVTQCKITPDRLKNMVSAFEPYGVTKQQIETRIQRKLEAITPAQFVKLTEIFNSLKDGMSEPSDWFEFSTEDVPHQTAAETLKATLKANTRAKAVPAPEPDSPFAPEEPDIFSDLVARIKSTKSKAAFKAVFDAVNDASVNGHITPEQTQELIDLMDAQGAK